MLGRRRILRGLSTSVFLYALPQLNGAYANTVGHRKTGSLVPPHTLKRPPRLRFGDAVALVNPGGVVSDDHIERAVKNAEALGLKPRLGKNLRARYGGYAGTAAERVDDLHTAWRDAEVKALWSVRGGSGTSHVLPLFDYERCAQTPKVLMGYSDMTALLNAVTLHAKLLTFHTPSGISTLSPYSKLHLEKVLFEGATPHAMLPALENEMRAASEAEYALRIHRSGVAEGELVGGNLSVFTSLIGTPFMPSLAGKILFLEDINEAPYRIDRMLTQLSQFMTARREFPVATIFGVCRKCEATDGEPSLTLQEVIRDYAARQPGLVASGFSFGHIGAQMTLPLGARARINTDEKLLTLLDAVVE